MQATAETFFEAELGTYEGYLPDDATLAAIALPVMVLVSTQTHGVYGQAAGRLAERLGVKVTRTPGTHMAYHNHPHELAGALRPFLRQPSRLTGQPLQLLARPAGHASTLDPHGMLRPL
jgi:pimeloyl-ACP methyl ester carboxylesterase